MLAEWKLILKHSVLTNSNVSAATIAASQWPLTEQGTTNDKKIATTTFNLILNGIYFDDSSAPSKTAIFYLTFRITTSSEKNSISITDITW